MFMFWECNLISKILVWYYGILDFGNCIVVYVSNCNILEVEVGVLDV